MIFLGLDLGTTGVKAAVYDETGTLLTLSYDVYKKHVAAGKRELMADDIWNSCEKVLKEALKEHPGQEKAAFAVSSFGEAFVCMDQDGHVLTPVMLLTDDRGTKEFESVVASVGSGKIMDICGLKPHMSYSASKILYLKNYCPEQFEKTKYILLMEDFIYFKLGGRRYTDYSLASRTMLFDVHKKAWSKELLDAFGLNEDLFSQPVQGGTVIGNVLPDVARQLGFPKDTYLVMGGHDQGCCALAGRGKESYTVCSMGTSACLTPVLTNPLPVEMIRENGFPYEPFLIRDRYITLAYNVTSGLLVDWFVKTFAKKEAELGEEVFKILESEMPSAGTRIFVLPYLHGSGTPYLDPGARLAFAGIDETCSRGDMYKAVLEGLCMDMRLNMESLGGDKFAPQGILAVGGGSKSSVWMQMMADILHCPIHLMESSQAGTLGCAVLGALAMNVYSSLHEAVDHMVKMKQTFWPQNQVCAFYDRKYEVYKTLHEDLKKVNDFASREQ